MERTLVLVKPDGVRRGLTGEIIARLERKGLRIAAMRMMRIDKDLAHRHYAEHVGKPFFGPLVAFITSGPVVALVLEGPKAIEATRQVMGVTDPLKAAPGSIRGDYGMDIEQNLIHGSANPQDAEREVKLFFPRRKWS